IFEGVAPSVAGGKDTAMLRELVGKAATRAKDDLADQPEVRAELQQTIALVYRELGLFDQMEAVARENLIANRSIFGEENLAVAEAVDRLAEALGFLGKLDEAEKATLESLAIKEALLGLNHDDVAISLGNLGVNQKRLGKRAESEATLRRALSIVRRVQGDTH